MAYKYKHTEDGVTIQYNITPDFSEVIHEGDTITITGQVSGYSKKIDMIDFSLYGALGDTLVSIPARGTGTFSFTGTAPSMSRILAQEVENGLGYFDDQLMIGLNTRDASDPSSYTGQGYGLEWYRCCRTISAPTVWEISEVQDAFRTLDGSLPMAKFGGYIQNRSSLTLRMRILTSTRYRWNVTITGGSLTEPLISSGSVYQNANWSGLVLCNLGLVTFSGDVTVTLTVSALGFDPVAAAYTWHVFPYANPVFSGFDVTRYIEELTDQGIRYVASDDGTRVWITTAGFVQTIPGTVEDGGGNTAGNAWSVDFTYAPAGGQARTVQGALGGDDGGPGLSFDVSEDRTLVTDVDIDATQTWEFTATLTDAVGTAVTATALVYRAGGYLNVEKGGVAVGMRSTGTITDPLFEVAPEYENRFYGALKALGGVDGVTNYVAGEVATGGTWIDGKPIYRFVAFLTGVTEYNNSVRVLGTLPTLPDTVISVRGTFQDGAASGSNPWRPMPYAGWNSSQNERAAILVRSNTGEICGVWDSASTYRPAKKVVAIVEYTKAD